MKLIFGARIKQSRAYQHAKTLGYATASRLLDQLDHMPDEELSAQRIPPENKLTFSRH